MKIPFLKPFIIGNLQFPINLIQGPLAGISCAPFRFLTEKYSAPAFTYTEMISCSSLLYQPQVIYQRYLKKIPGEGKVAVQLAGSDPVILKQAVMQATDYGADLIDLNCGCPVKKIRRKGSGSKLLTDPLKLFKLITAMKNNTHVPILIKIRIPEKTNEAFNFEIAKVIEEAGADCLIIHGRHWTEHYETPCQYEKIQFFVEALKIPVVGNGDIIDLKSFKNMAVTGCQGMMISRGSVGQPWFIRKLIAEIKNESFLSPSASEIGLIWLQHVSLLAELLNNDYQALLQARKFSKYYARHLPNKAAFCEALNQCKNLSDLQKISYLYFI